MDVKTHKFLKTTSLAVFVLSVFTFPLFGFVVMFGLMGPQAGPITLMAIGYLGTFFSSLLSIFKPKYFWLVVLSLLIGIVGHYLDTNDAKQKNADFCAELRAEPTCVETACGFTCEEFGDDGFGLTTSYEVCADKSEQHCVAEMSESEQVYDLRKKALDRFEEIVLKIVQDKNPQTLNFERERTIIYNCLKEIRDDGGDGELAASARLRSLSLTSNQLDKYYDYLAAHGQNVTRQASRPVAGLSAGDPSLSCDDL